MHYPLLETFLTMVWAFIWVLWIFLVAAILVDVFRSADLSGWGKAGWTVLVLVLPFIGVFAYLITRGGEMHERQVHRAQLQEEKVRAYIKDAAGGGGTAGELKTLTELKERGVINDIEYEREKAKILS